MKIHHGISQFKYEKPVILTTGTFDGVHLGHQKMLAKLINEARQTDSESVLLTFYPHPRMVLNPDDHDLKLLTSPEEKYLLLSEMGLDHLIIQPFDNEFSSISAHHYIRDILIGNLGVKKIIAGYDHRFGKNREGNFDTLVEMSEIFEYQVEQISARELNEVKISSTKIRNALLAGDVATAENYLGRSYQISGKIVAGKKLGSQLGFPTANLEVIYPFKLIPKNGVYVVRVNVNEKMVDGILNIGVRPTVSESNNTSIEVHLIDWYGDIYGTEITLIFVDRLRDECKFENREELIKQLHIDKQNAIKILKK